MSGNPESDSRFMRRALALAERGWGRVAPNPLVGAVVVREGEIVGEGWHAEYGGPHAEAAALRDAGERARGATLYVTLEPCAHQGKTPACTDAVRTAGVREVVYACADPHPVAGGGAESLRQSGIRVRGGVEEERARALLAPFFRSADPSAPRRPWLELKLALSLDGRIADLHGRSHWITGEGARDEVHRLRAGADAIAVGIGTALADDPRLTVRRDPAPRRTPVRIVFDRNLRLPTDSRVATSVDEAPLWIVGSGSAPADRRKNLESLGARIVEAEDLVEAVQAIFAAEINSVFCEGGATLAGALLNAELVDRLTLFYAPLFLGPEAIDPFRDLVSGPLEKTPRWRPHRCAAYGPDTLISMDR